METKQLMCNDCGCRFEIKETKGSQPEKPKSAPGENRPAQAGLSCPECRSYNITTA